MTNHTIFSNAISAAQKIHVAMCRFDEKNAAQTYLNEAMHAVLIIAEECRQEHKKGPP